VNEIIEGTAIEIANEAVEVVDTTHGGWAGDQPVFLIHEPADGVGGNIGIDIDVDGWIEGNRDTFRRPGIWFLMDKENGEPKLCLSTIEGDQFFYHRHHVGIIGSAATASVAVHVIGRKRGDEVTRLWLMPNGMVMTGEEGDVDPVATRMVGM